MPPTIESFPPCGLAVVIGASGGLGSALTAALSQSTRFAACLGLSRSVDGLDVTDEATIIAAAQRIAATDLELRLVLVATGLLHEGALQPEKSWRQIEAAHLERSFAVNAIGPALLAKHLLPLMPRSGKAVFGAVSAKVGSIGDNRLGGWYGYRAAKAALNQLIHTAAIELARTRPEAVCVTLHPGTVETKLSAPFASGDHATVSADVAAERLLGVVERLAPADTGLLLDHSGVPLPW